MPRILFLFPTTTYRAQAFLAAARKLRLQIAVASEEPSTIADLNPAGLLTLNFNQPEETARQVLEFARVHPIDAVIPVDEQTAIVAATVASAIGLCHNSVESAQAAGNKFLMRERLRARAVRIPQYQLRTLEDDSLVFARAVRYPCVLKPLILSASRGVIRANSEKEFVLAFKRVAAILGAKEIAARGGAARQVLIEEFVPGKEVALEGLLSRGELRVLALFDKPEPLDGPFFEETIYVTPSNLPDRVQDEIAVCTARAAEALGLWQGPIHAELRINEEGPCLIEVAARSIGGRCSGVLRFDDGMSLEELILRHALGWNVQSVKREAQAAGVMMIPIPEGGILKEIRGLSEAESVSHVDTISITTHIGQKMVPLPEGSQYLGFIFARAEEPHEVVAALKEAHRCLEFVL